jgi:type 1 glutamine amidotransferase
MLKKHLLVGLAIWVLLAAAVVAAPPYKALIVDGQNGHDWKATTPPLKKLLEQTGMFTVDVATSPPRKQDMSGFRPKFSDYDLVVSNYAGDPWPEETRKAFVDYVEGGGGVVIYHFACAAFPDWKEYNEITGLGGWGGRNEKAGPYVRWRDGKFVRDTSPGHGGGHGPAQPFQLVIREPNHPITNGLPKAFMHPTDELYGWLRGPAKNLTVLATAFAPKDKGGAGEHEPILMTIRYGKGRVFHTALGHTDEQLRSVSFIATFQRGAEWAATGKVTQKVPDDFPGPDEPSIRE